MPEKFEYPWTYGNIRGQAVSVVHTMRLAVQATQLVPAEGTSGVPQIRGELRLLETTAHKLGLSAPHPLQRIVRSGRVRYFFLLMDEQFMTTRNGVSGIPVCLDFRDTTPSPGVVQVSTNGRNVLAPFWMAGETGRSDFPGAIPLLERRALWEDGRWVSWQSYLPIGFANLLPPHLRQPAWIYGVPLKAGTMHDEGNLVRQLVLVPDAFEALGLGKQTLREEELTRAITVLWHVPSEQGFRSTSARTAWSEAEARRHAELMAQRGNLESLEGALRPESGSTHIMAAGGLIRQWFTRDYLSPSEWEPVEAFVLFPVTRDRTAQLL
jgi:hypothetical protein